MPDEDFITVRRNGGDVNLWAVDSQVMHFKNTCSTGQLVLRNHPCLKKKFKKSTFRKVV